MSRALRVLHLEDSPDDAALLVRYLTRSGFNLTHRRVENAEEFIQALEESWDVIISDYVLPGFDALTALRLAREKHPDLPFLVVSGAVGEETAAEMMRAGAQDFINKDRMARLGPAIERELEESANRRERRRAEQMLYRSETRFRRLTEANILGIMVADLEGRILEANETLLGLLGYTREEVRAGKLRWDAITPPEYKSWDELVVQQLREHGVAPPWEKEYYRSDGSRVPVLVGVAELEKAGECIAYVIDLTERRRAEEALRASQERLRLAQQAAKIWSWEYDVRARQVTWSQNAVNASEHPTSVENYLSGVHPDDRERVVQSIEFSLRQGEDYDLEYRVISRKGEVKWIAARGSVFHEGGQPVRMLGIGMDITGRKHAEEVMRTTEKLAATGRMAATIAHEINNPLEAVTNLLYLLDADVEVSGRTKEYVRLAQQELARVVQIVRQTLGFYRDTSAPVPVRTADLIDNVLELYARRIEQKHIVLDRRFEDPGVVRGFPGELRQVFSNLVVNAVEALPPGGRLWLHVARRHERTRAGRPGISLVVADNGPGIRAEHQPKIFEPFFTTKGEKGTGLGLWVSRGIVHKHGGSIRLRSSTDPHSHGTVFSVFLPAGEQPR